MDQYEQDMASRDGEAGYGGCRHCQAIYELTYIGNGKMIIRIGHNAECPIVQARLKELPGFISDRDLGDEQDEH